VNRSATWAEWDEELLALELAEVHELGLDLAFTGFDPQEIDDLLFRSNLAGEDEEAPAPVPEQVTTRAGDLWLCGKHRLLCGDATSSIDVCRLLEAVVPVVMITDPPYGVSYQPAWRGQAGLGEPRQTGKVANDDCADWTAAYRLFSGDVAYVWHAGKHTAEVAGGLLAADFELRAQIIWAKQHFALSRGHYHWQHEPCFYAVRRGRNARWCGDRTQSTLWEVPNLNPFGPADFDEQPTGHGTQKPVELMKRPILNHTQRGEWVYDPFLGSGTTLVAAELTERKCCALELEPAYVDMALIRWEARTGDAARLAADGRRFAEVRAERLGSLDRKQKGKLHG
jgi:DNA modification methylase